MLRSEIHDPYMPGVILPGLSCCCIQVKKSQIVDRSGLLRGRLGIRAGISRIKDMGKSNSKTGSGKTDSKKADAKEENKAKVDACLKEHDKENSGFISKADTAEALKKLIPDLAEDNLNHLLNTFDKDNEDKINIEKLSSFLSGVKTKKDEIKKDDWLDTSNEEKLSYADLKSLLKETYQFDDDTAKTLVLICDGNEDGEVDRKEYEKMWTSLSNW